MENSIDSPETLLLRGARVVLPDRIEEAGDLFIESGSIARINGPAGNVVASADRILDLSGLTLYPGFIDVHIHGAMGVDTMEATPDLLHRVARFLAQHGITGWLPTLVPAPLNDYEKPARAVEHLMLEQDVRGASARVLGLHYEGPFVNGAQCGALRPQHFRTFSSTADLDALATVNNADAAHMMTLAPEVDGGLELISELKKRGWIVSIGHTRAPLDVLDRASEAGARHMTHFMNAMSPLHHRAPGPIGWGLVRDDMTCDFIADGVHLDQLTLQLILKCKTPARLNLISDAVAPAGLGDGDYHLWGETIRVTNGRTANEQGSIAGSVITMHDAVRMMLSLGVSPQDAALMSATNPARLLGLDQLYGSIEEGKAADLVALDEEGNVRLTLVGGRIAFQKSPESGV
ncbi:MAG TPA: N-acetylglucosamine-6-phosphate deacetylase [Pyrinomonadaceae bacterium]|jgi:N-acetylglucosamine-6-phosphate deacetylase|nr:N-acetylglucosamine-6-phosphate deacetylase [Pyrinomonadaceae bacterium]